MALQDSKAERRSASGSEGIAKITLGEIDDLLKQAQDEPEIGEDGFYTSREWASHWGVSRQTASTKLRQLLEHGLAESRNVTRRSTRGYLYPTVAYRIKE
jgi:Fic family protein